MQVLRVGTLPGRLCNFLAEQALQTHCAERWAELVGLTNVLCLPAGVPLPGKTAAAACPR